MNNPTESFLDLPWDHPRIAGGLYEYARVSVQIPPALAGALRAVAREHGAPLESLYLAAYAILLSRYANTQQVLVGTDSESVLLIECPPETTFPQLLRNGSPVVHPLPPFCNVFFIWGAGSPKSCCYDLALATGGGIATLVYCESLFEPATVERMARQYIRLLEAIAEAPEARLHSYDMMPAEERALVLGAYSGSSADYPRKTLHELFTEQATLHPDAEALAFGAERLTYHQLDERSNQIAQLLRREGIRPEDRIGIFMDRSAAMIVAMLGVLKAGGVYVPIDPAYPAERIKFIADDTDMRCVLTERSVRTKPPASAPLITVDAPDSPVAGCATEPVANLSTSESIAVMVYTSGSTGQPKAACIPHRAVVRMVRNSNQVEATPADRIAQVASPSFDAAIFEIWLALTNGAALVGMRREVLLGPAELMDFLRAERVSILILNTAYVHQIGRDAPHVLKGVRKVMFGGEAAEAGPLRNLLRHVAPGVLINSYGPAEGCVATTYHEIVSIPDDAITVPIGKPISNARMYLLDSLMRPVPIGLPGEIYIGGDGVAKGYWNRPELTAQKFLPDPFANKPGALLYRTGDLARLKADGDFEFIGRLDDQIKIRGHRIELAEVRGAIISHPEVRQLFLMAREDSPGDRRLVAYLTLRQALPSAPDLLRQWVRQKLPSHMVPSAFVILDSIPLNTNGKVDRAALPPPSHRPDMNGAYRAPQTQLERTLVRIWQALLRVDHIGVNDNFFDLGGHSLLAARLIAEIEKQTGQNIPVAALFEAPTIARLARKLADHTYAGAWAPLVELHAPAAAAVAPPFFCIHSLGANLVSIHKLASLLRGDRAIYGLQPPGLDGKEQPLDNVDAIASAYLQKIREKQPHGPYYLGGVCIGGVLAYEIAQRLTAAGEEVRFLGLIDSFLPGPLRYLHARSQLAEYLDCHLGEFLMLPGAARLKYLARWFGNGFVRLGWAMGLRPSASVARAARRVGEANIKAIRAHSPKPYAGHVTQFLSSDGPHRSYEDRRLAWSALASDGLEIHVVPGDHLTMLEEPHVHTLARELQACLERADGGIASLPSARSAA